MLVNGIGVIGSLVPKIAEVGFDKMTDAPVTVPVALKYKSPRYPEPQVGGPPPKLRLAG